MLARKLPSRPYRAPLALDRYFAEVGVAYDAQNGTLAPMSAPDKQQLQLRKSTGFTSLWADLGRSKKFRVATPGLAFEHSNLYGEFSEFNYTDAGPR